MALIFLDVFSNFDILKLCVVKQLGVHLAKQKVYAVRKGRRPGLYYSWPACEAEVRGYAGADFKSFATKAEAESYMMAEEVTYGRAPSVERINDEVEKKIASLREDEALAFIDGSFDKDDKRGWRYSFGAIIFTTEGEVTLSQAYENPEYVESRNVAGEIEGAKQAILWALAHSKRELTIYYDYEGIKKWATREWKANKKLTQEYSDFFQEKAGLIKVNFFHTKSHTGITHNERVDELAKQAFSEGR